MRIKTQRKPVHRIPNDLQKVIKSNPKARDIWKNITPLARNEWICWIISTKKQEIRNRRIKRTIIELIEGKSRPCCWPGCKHNAQ